jgi:hypothetical protein
MAMNIGIFLFSGSGPADGMAIGRDVATGRHAGVEGRSLTLPLTASSKAEYQRQ